MAATLQRRRVHGAPSPTRRPVQLGGPVSLPRGRTPPKRPALPARGRRWLQDHVLFLQWIDLLDAAQPSANLFFKLLREAERLLGRRSLGPFETSGTGRADERFALVLERVVRACVRVLAVNQANTLDAVCWITQDLVFVVGSVLHQAVQDHEAMAPFRSRLGDSARFYEQLLALDITVPYRGGDRPILAQAIIVPGGSVVRALVKIPLDKIWEIHEPRPLPFSGDIGPAPVPTGASLESVPADLASALRSDAEPPADAATPPSTAVLDAELPAVFHRVVAGLAAQALNGPQAKAWMAEGELFLKAADVAALLREQPSLTPYASLLSTNWEVYEALIRCHLLTQFEQDQRPLRRLHIEGDGWTITDTLLRVPLAAIWPQGINPPPPFSGRIVPTDNGSPLYDWRSKAQCPTPDLAGPAPPQACEAAGAELTLPADIPAHDRAAAHPFAQNSLHQVLREAVRDLFTAPALPLNGSDAFAWIGGGWIYLPGPCLCRALRRVLTGTDQLGEDPANPILYRELVLAGIIQCYPSGLPVCELRIIGPDWQVRDEMVRLPLAACFAPEAARPADFHGRIVTSQGEMLHDGSAMVSPPAIGGGEPPDNLSEPAAAADSPGADADPVLEAFVDVVRQRLAQTADTTEALGWLIRENVILAGGRLCEALRKHPSLAGNAVVASNTRLYDYLEQHQAIAPFDHSNTRTCKLRIGADHASVTAIRAPAAYIWPDSEMRPASRFTGRVQLEDGAPIDLDFPRVLTEGLLEVLQSAQAAGACNSQYGRAWVTADALFVLADTFFEGLCARPGLQPYLPNRERAAEQLMAQGLALPEPGGDNAVWSVLISGRNWQHRAACLAIPRRRLPPSMQVPEFAGSVAYSRRQAGFHRRSGG